MIAAGSILGVFEIGPLIGKGGMGEVYRARDTKLGRDVAVKVLPASLNDDADRLARFEREALVLASLNHPNIATVHDYQHIEGCRFLVMEIVEGDTLQVLIHEGRLPSADIPPIFTQIVNGLAAAHARGIIHRDLKPPNIKRTHDERVKILDFGMAKPVEASSESTPYGSKETTAGIILGTPPYMSPEQTRGHAPTAATDIWAFGCCLYEALTGELAFDGETMVDTLTAIIHDEPDYGRIPDETPAQWVELVRACLAKKPEDRLSDIRSAQRFFGKVSPSEPITIPRARATGLSCPACGAANGSGAKFCGQCGEVLRTECNQCGAAMDPGHKFCSHCGAPQDMERLAVEGRTMRIAPPDHLARAIERDRAKVEGERRVVSVLFADAAGFAPASERLDEEEVYGLMQGCFSCMSDAIHDYEGTIVQYTGDGLMAVFGAPIAHEDSARRAVLAGLALQRSLKSYADDVHRRHNIECRFRVGINTGPIIVHSIGKDFEMTYSSLGDTVNLASGAEGRAASGSVYITENTYRSVREFFAVEPVNAGLSVPVYSVTGNLRSDCDINLVHGRGLSDYVGRDHEIATMEHYFNDLSDGRGRVIVVSGEAGLGKSRLLHEFRKRIGVDAARWFEGQCIPLGGKTAYLPIIGLVRSMCGIAEEASDKEIIDRVEREAAAWPEASRVYAKYIRSLLNVEPGDPSVDTLDPRERRAYYLDAIRTIVRNKIADEPAVITLEDLHWVDDASQEAITAILDTVPASKCLVIMTTRPGYANETYPDRSYVTGIALSHLGREASNALIGSVVDQKPIPKKIEQLIAAKAEGNPFFIEEVTKSLIEDGTLVDDGEKYVVADRSDSVRIPDRVQDVILARVDRLPQDARQALQIASVIGREFTVRLLHTISSRDSDIDLHLGHLKQLEIIYETGYAPELTFMFKHALTHEVAYGMLLADQRRSLHSLVGESIEAIYQDRLVDHYEALAHHYYEAQVWEKALRYCERAGDKAAAACANDEAIHYYRRAGVIAADLGEPEYLNRYRILDNLAMLLAAIGRFSDAIAVYTDLAGMTRSMGNTKLQSIVLGRRAFIEWQNHDFDTAIATAFEAADLAGDANVDAKFTALLTAWYTMQTSGQMEKAEPYRQQLISMEAKVKDPVAQTMWRAQSGIYHNWCGDYDTAIDLLQGDVQGPILMRAGHHWVHSLALIGAGRYQQALDLLHDLYEQTSKFDEFFYRIRTLNTIGWLHKDLYSFEESINWNQKSVEAAMAVETKDLEVENQARLNLGESLMGLGRYSEARDQFDRVEAAIADPPSNDIMSIWSYSQHLLYAMGELAYIQEDYDRASTYADQCFYRATQFKRKKYIIKSRVLRAKLRAEAGSPFEALNELDDILVAAEALGNPPQIWKTLLARADVKAQLGAKDAADDYGLAADRVKRSASAIQDRELANRLTGSREVARMRESAQ